MLGRPSVAWFRDRAEVAGTRRINMELSSIKALTFDVFGTVVDWRTSVARDARKILGAKGHDLDWNDFALRWRSLYQPAMGEVRSGHVDWRKLDDLHEMNLEHILADLNIHDLKDSEVEHLNQAWHRLDPWPDSVEGLTRLKSRYIVATLSNGNVSLLVNMAKRGGIPWDVVLSAEIAGYYKPDPEAYLKSAEILDLRPEQCLMVAAHNADLVSAATCGFHTAFVARLHEYGPGQTTDLQPEHAFDFVARDLVDLAEQLGT